MAKYLSFIFFAGAIFFDSSFAQTTMNPDISLIGDARVFSHSDASRPNESRKFNLASPDMEFMISGYLNPYSRADAVISWEEGSNAEIEEVYATVLRGLPLGMNVRVGKYRLEFGRLNPVHPHAYSFIYQPLPQQKFFGDEGLNDMAIRTSFLLPTGDLYTEIMGAVLKGDMFNSVESISQSAEAGAASIRIKPGFFGRLTTSAAVSDHGEFTAGASLVTAEYDPGLHLRRWVYGIDMKYKWKPDRNTSLTIEGEGMSNRQENSERNKILTSGGYGYIDYRFHQKYNFGAIIEYSQGEFSNKNHSHRVGGFIGFAPIEETSLVRLVGSWSKGTENEGFWTATVQFVFSLGPHQPHQF